MVLGLVPAGSVPGPFGRASPLASLSSLRSNLSRSIRIDIANDLRFDFVSLPPSRPFGPSTGKIIQSTYDKNR
jgi:hypothetical protein